VIGSVIVSKRDDLSIAAAELIDRANRGAGRDNVPSSAARGLRSSASTGWVQRWLAKRAR